MRVIAKNFENLKQAERHQNKLYGEYEMVRLIRSPHFGESGTYVWEVK